MFFFVLKQQKNKQFYQKKTLLATSCFYPAVTFLTVINTLDLFYY